MLGFVFSSFSEENISEIFSSHTPQEDDIPLSLLATQLSQAGCSVTEQEVRNFVRTEEGLQTSASLTDAEIAAQVKEKRGEGGAEESADIDAEGDAVEIPPASVSFSDCM